MNVYIYNDILNKIQRIEKAMKRLDMDGFLISKKELRDVVIAIRESNNKDDAKHMKEIIILNEMLDHLNRLEKIDDYYKWTKFRINSDGDIALFLDAYVRDTLDIIDTINGEIKEYGYGYLAKFVTKFYTVI